MWRFGLFAALVIGCVAPALAAEKRIALVVGIDEYSNFLPGQQLQKAGNDATAVAEAFRSLGFDDVIFGTNLSYRDFNDKLFEFETALNPGDTAAVFYAGHGVEIGGQNYLLPKDIRRLRENEQQKLMAESVSLERIEQLLYKKGTRVSVIIIDACRDNPFADKVSRGLGSSRGLSIVDPPTGTFMMFSASAHQEALDRLPQTSSHPDDEDPNSVYTRTLLPLLRQGNLPIQEIAKRVKRQVYDLAKSRDHDQIPAQRDELLDNFCFGGCDPLLEEKPAPNLPVVANARKAVEPAGAAASGSVVEASPPPRPPDGRIAVEAAQKPGSPKDAEASREVEGEFAYQDCIRTNELACYRQFLMGFPKHKRADQVQEIIKAQIELPKYQLCTDAVSRADRLSACYTYTIMFPEGNWITDAKRELDEASAPPQKRPEPPQTPPATPVALPAPASVETPSVAKPRVEELRQFTAYDSYDVPGGDYGGALKDVTLDKCRFVCENDTRCNAYTYDRRNNWCFMKDRADRLAVNANAVSGILSALDQPEPSRAESPSPPAPARPSRQARDFVTYDGYDIPGGDYGGAIKNVSRDSCMSACRSDGGCVAFTYDKKNRWCFLKSSAGGREPNGKAFSGVLSSRSSSVGMVTAAGGGMQMLTDTDFTGMDLDRSGIKPTSLGACRQICLGNPGCQAFSWIRESGWCWPKSGIPRPRNKSGVISGFRN